MAPLSMGQSNPLSALLALLALDNTQNDVSLRNILVLSVFGATDMAASCGFVLVRLIMVSLAR